MSGSRTWLLAGAALALCACNKHESTPAAPTTEPSATSTSLAATAPATPGRAATSAAVLDTTEGHLNLQNLVHLADIDHGGLFIDFGTPARMKYTVGQWKTGWGKDGVSGDTTYTYVASVTGRVYFPLDNAAPVTLRFRLRPVGTSTMQPFLNNQALPTVHFDKGDGFATYDVQVPAGKARAGENYLLLRFGGTKPIGGEDVAVAMDSLHVIPAAKSQKLDTSYSALPIYSALVQEVAVEGQKRRAITVSAPTTLSYYIAVPKGAKLSLGVGSPDSKAGSASALVRVTPEGGRTKELWHGRLAGAWQQPTLSLAQWAGDVIKLDLSAQGQGVVGFASPVIVAPDPGPTMAKSTPAKSVIVLLIDTMRADHLQAYNKSTRVRTPVLSAFAKQATVFDHAQAPENWTKPSVASVLTGLYPMTHRAKQSDSVLSDDALMVSEVFQKAGFATASFLANGYVSDKFGFKQGWDYYTNYIRENKNTNAENVFRDAGNWVAKHKNKRFFLYIQTIDPHVPYDPPDEYFKMYHPGPYHGKIRPRMTADVLEKAKRVPPKATLDDADRDYVHALYDGEVSYHDHYLGVFIERLKKLGLYDKVMFVITADHGEEFYDHGSYGHGHSVYQELLHVPFMLRYPGNIPVRRIDETVSTVDISPTVIAAAGLKVPDVMEGVNLMPELHGALLPGPAVAFSDFLDDRHVIVGGRWKLILRGVNATLFDLKRDPHELKELDIHDYPIAMRYCRILLGQFMGARDRGDWIDAVQTGKSVELNNAAAEMDEATKAGLKALGYAN